MKADENNNNRKLDVKGSDIIRSEREIEKSDTDIDLQEIVRFTSLNNSIRKSFEIWRKARGKKEGKD